MTFLSHHLNALEALPPKSKALLYLGGGLTLVSAAVAFVKRRRALAVGEQVVEKIKSVLGTPYIWGSRNPAKGLDCSGAVVWALRELGLEPKKWNATAASMHKDSSKVIFPQPGDLAFYGGGLFSDVSHVMVYAGNGLVIGATGGGPLTKTVADARDRNAAVKLVPVDYRKDFAGYGRLPVQAAAGDAVVGAEHLSGYAILGMRGASHSEESARGRVVSSNGRERLVDASSGTYET